MVRALEARPTPLGLLQAPAVDCLPPTAHHSYVAISANSDPDGLQSSYVMIELCNQQSMYILCNCSDPRQ